MIKKLAIITAAYIFLSFWVSQIDTASPMPMLFSVGFGAAAIKLTLIGALIYIVVIRKFKYRLFRQLAGLIGLGLLALGSLGTLSTDIQFNTYPLLMSMDYVTILETGILMVLASLSYGYESDKLALRKPIAVNWQSTQLRLLRTQESLASLFAKRRVTTSGFRRHSQPVN